jgi:hypothetical protein
MSHNRRKAEAEAEVEVVTEPEPEVDDGEADMEDLMAAEFEKALEGEAARVFAPMYVEDGSSESEEE